MADTDDRTSIQQRWRKKRIEEGHADVRVLLTPDELDVVDHISQYTDRKSRAAALRVLIANADKIIPLKERGV